MRQKIFDWANRNILNLFLVFLIALNIAPIAAPILTHLGLEFPAKIIYTIYSFFCHQQHWKSLHLFDYQVAWCARDMFIWGSMLFALILVKLRSLQPLSIFSLLIYSIPMAMDGGIQTIAAVFGYSSGNTFYTSTNPMRMLTGTLFGSAMGLFMFPRLKEIVDEENTNKLKPRTKPAHGKIVAGMLLVMIVVYFVFIQMWKHTSTEYLPSNSVDSEIKIPQSREEWFDRRKHGI